MQVRRRRNPVGVEGGIYQTVTQGSSPAAVNPGLEGATPLSLIAEFNELIT
jgi:hypothetical protein